MAPLLVGIAWAWARRGGSRPATPRPGVRKAVPLFVLGFVAMTVLRSVGIIGPELADVLGSLSGWCILVGLAAVGLSIRVADLRAVGPTGLRGGLGAAVVIGIGTLIAIVSLGLGAASRRPDPGRRTPPRRGPIRRVSGEAPVRWSAWRRVAARPGVEDRLGVDEIAPSTGPDPPPCATQPSPGTRSPPPTVVTDEDRRRGRARQREGRRRGDAEAVGDPVGSASSKVPR